jgi:hypothetical protein
LVGINDEDSRGGTLPAPSPLPVPDFRL